MTDPGSSARSDAELFAASQTGDRDALETLLQRHLPRLSAFVRSRLDPAMRARESGTDFVQSACREALEHAGTFTYRSDEEFRGWLYTIALNKIRERTEHFAAQKRGAGAFPRPMPDSGVVDARGACTSPSQMAIGHELEERMQQALDRLSEDHREVITLSRIAGLSHAEIARHMAKSEGAVRVLLSRALLRLVAVMQEIGGERPDHGR